MSSIAAGIVAFNPDIDRLESNILNIRNQVEKLYVIDNASDNLKDIEKLCDKYDAHLVANIENYGIAKALNQMCQFAQREGYEWIVTLDQDTITPLEMVAEMRPYLSNEKIGIVCPAVRYEGRKDAPKLSKTTNFVHACMTSASLTKISVWSEVSGFKEEFFIDFVDNEFCMKLSIAGYRILRVNACVISHQLGDIREITILGIIKKTTISHSPWRFYYMIRNNKFFITEYKSYLNFTKELLKLWYIMIEGYISSNQKRATFMSMRQGYKDGKMKVLGKSDCLWL